MVSEREWQALEVLAVAARDGYLAEQAAREYVPEQFGVAAERLAQLRRQWIDAHHARDVWLFSRRRELQTFWCNGDVTVRVGSYETTIACPRGAATWQETNEQLRRAGSLVLGRLAHLATAAISRELRAETFDDDWVARLPSFHG